MMKAICTLTLVLVFGANQASSHDERKMPPKSRNTTASTGYEDVNIYFAHDFQNDTLGNYRDKEWRYDWYGKSDLIYPGWSNHRTARICIDKNDARNKVMRWSYPKGALGPNEGGGQWEVRFARPFDDVYFSYRIKFMPGFKWNLGGKIPGLGGGYQYESERHGRKSRFAFTASLMFKQKGNIVFYTYNPDQKGEYGDSLAWNFQMPTGRWINIAIHVKLNDVGRANGVLEGFIDGKFIKRFDALRFRDASTADAGIDFMKIYTFFGGNTEDWATPIDQWIEVDDFVLFNFKPGASPRDKDGKLRIPMQLGRANQSGDRSR